ncbi:MAG: DUF4430 domain-containing protein [Thermoleophilia bacterium]|nr:DUF4430 domain-containing protein [Thermoleophilia bacterium]
MARMRQPVMVTIAAAVVASAWAVGGCGSGGAADNGGISPATNTTLIITRDFGRETIAAPRVLPLARGLTAMRQLQAAAKTETSYGGRYVTAIDGRAQNMSAGYDWLFYVDGEEADAGAAAVRLSAGQIVQWDYHRWRDIQTGKAIVGAFPRPLIVRGAVLDCRPVAAPACRQARTALRNAGVGLRDATGAVRVVVGEWDKIAAAPGVPELGAPAAQNGAFARISGPREQRELGLVSDDGRTVRTIARGGGLVAAVRTDGRLTWIVTGADARGALLAARMLTRKQLRGRFAVAVDEHGALPLPLPSVGGMR